jgi:hypothetical protein
MHARSLCRAVLALFLPGLALFLGTVCAGVPPLPPLKPFPKHLLGVLSKTGESVPWAADGPAAAFLVPSQNRVLIVRGEELSEVLLDAPPDGASLLGIFAFDSTDNVFAIGDPGPPKILIYRGTRFVRTITVDRFLMRLDFQRRNLLVAVDPVPRQGSDQVVPTKPPATFDYLLRYSLDGEKLGVAVTVAPPKWAAELARQEREQVHDWARLQGASRGSVPPPESRNSGYAPLRWGTGIPVPRRDGRMWFVNQYDGEVLLLSPSGAVERRDTLAGVERSGYTDAEKDAIRKRFAQSDRAPAQPKDPQFPALVSQVFSACVVDYDLLVLAKSKLTNGEVALIVLRDSDMTTQTFSLPAGGNIRRVQATEDGTVWFGATWGRLSSQELGLGAAPTKEDEAAQRK